MDLMDTEQAKRILEALLSRGGDFAEIYCQWNHYTRITLDDGKLEEVLAGEDAGLALRLVSADRTFFYSGNELAPGALQSEALRLARAVEPAGPPGRVTPFRPDPV